MEESSRSSLEIPILEIASPCNPLWDLMALMARFLNNNYCPS